MRALLVLLCLVACPAIAKPIAALQGQGATVVLDDERHSCPAGTQRVSLIGQARTSLGCWFVAHGTVWLFWDDGDVGAVPQRLFRWETV